jgi:hypothetical protein
MILKRPRRALVLTTEDARHPFRRSLPPHVCANLVEDEVEDGGDRPTPRSFRQAFNEDWRSLLTTYCAGFVAVVTFIA